MENQYLGVDYSTRKVSVALIDGSGRLLAVRSWSRRAKDRPQLSESIPELAHRVREIVASLMEEPGSLRPSAVASAVVEHPIVGGSGNRQTAIGMAMASGAIIAELSAMLPGSVVLAHVATWKKAVCGNGSMDKEQVGEWLRDRHPEMHAATNGDDDVDAVCMALYGRSIDDGDGA